jgi:hypothetical protein
MNETRDRIEEIFAAAVELPVEARSAYLDQACAGDSAARARVEALLQAHDRAGHLLDRPAIPAPDPRGRPGTVIAGRYKLLEELGEGGMGTVWVAEQTEPVRRKVALKLIKPGMDSRQVLARFEQERQALALMDHPNIAKVLDGGLTEAGRPFFVMEYVKGVPITQYCDAARLSVPERLYLFVQVCQAVQHAHQKGIIHRDLKPSNILVAPYDDKPVPKVIDFGLAKAIHTPLTERTLHTAHEAIVGTPLYMSPEQAQLNNLDVDTRTDIYSLGALLYELLTGTPPLERQQFKEAAWEEVRRIIREEEPPRPSTRLSSTATLASLAACRQTEPVRLTKLVRGELDWIVMKALEKDRNRRYETANGFGMDVQRFLAGEPVLAVPPSAGYRLRKFARKHRAALTTAAVIALLLVSGVAVSSWQAVRARQAEGKARQAAADALQAQQAEAERAAGEEKAKQEALLAVEAEKKAKQAEADRAEGERQAKQKALEAAAAEKAARADAQKRLEQLQKANEIITSIFADLDIRKVKAGTEPLEAVLAQRLVKAAEQLEGEAVGDPLVVADLQDRLGRTLLSLGHASEAIPLFIKAWQTSQAKLGADHPDTLASMNNLALGYRDAGKLDLALPLWEETLKLRKAKLGADHPATLTSMGSLASCYWDAGKLDLALPLWEETLKLKKAKLGADHPETLTSMTNLALGYQDVGKLDLALPLYEEAVKLMKAKLGADHPDTLFSMGSLASCYRDAGKLDLALPLYEETLKLTKAKLGADHPDTLASMNGLAVGYWDAGKLDLALPLWEETLKLRKAKLGADHPDTLASMNNLALGYRDAGKLDLALPLWEETLKLRKAKLGADHPATLASMNGLAVGYWDSGKLDLALPLWEETLKLRKAKLGADHPDTLASMNNLALGYQAAGKLDLALPLFKEAAAGMEKRHFQHKSAWEIVDNLIGCYERLKQFDEAEVWRRKWLAVVKEQSGAESVPYADKLAALGLNLLQQRKWSDAETVLRDCLAIREKKEPDAWNTFDTQSLLGGALLNQKKYTDAEPLLLKGYEGIKQRADKIPARVRTIRLTEAIERLVQLYEATGNKDEAAKWRKELEAIKKP